VATRFTSLEVPSADSIEHDQKKRRLELALEKVRYEAEHAQRQYEAVDPCNRLVAAELEVRWNRALPWALTQVAEAEARLSAHQQSQTTLSEEERNRLLQMGPNFERGLECPINTDEKANHSNAY
jgi:hypothetical protein